MPGQPSPIYLNDNQLEMFGHIANKGGIETIRRRRRLIAFGWYGGKFSHLDWLLPLLPACHHYCEPFGGSAAVLLNRAPSPVETYNDIDGEVSNFFRVPRRAELVSRFLSTNYAFNESDPYSINHDRPVRFPALSSSTATSRPPQASQ